MVTTPPARPRRPRKGNARGRNRPNLKVSPRERAAAREALLQIEYRLARAGWPFERATSLAVDQLVTVIAAEPA